MILQAFGKFGISVIGIFAVTAALAYKVQCLISWFLQPVFPTNLNNLPFEKMMLFLIFIMGVAEVFGLIKSKGEYEEAYAKGMFPLAEYYFKGCCTVLITVALFYVMKVLIGQL